MKYNLLETLMSFRNQLVQTVTKQNDMLSGVTNSLIDGLSRAADYSYTTVDGSQCFTISTADSGSCTVQMYDTVNDTKVFERTYTSISDMASDVWDNEASDMRVNSLEDLLDDVNNSESFNALLAKVNDVVLNTGSITATQYQTLLSTVQTNSSIQQLTEIVGSSDEVNSLQWCQIINQLLKPSKTSLEKGSIIMDDSTANVIQSINSTMIGQIISSVAQIVGVLLVAVTKILGAIVFLAGNIISKIWNSQTEFDVNIKSSTNYLDGPPVACYLAGSGSGFTLPSTGKELNTADGIQLASTPWSDSYVWKQDAANTAYNIFLKYGVDYDKIHGQWFSNGQGSIICGFDNSVNSTYSIDGEYVNDNCMIDEESYYTDLTNKESILKSLTAACCLTWLGFLTTAEGNQISSVTCRTSESGYNLSPSPDLPLNPSLDSLDDFMGRMLYYIIHMGSSDKTHYMSEGNIANFCNWIRFLSTQQSANYYAFPTDGPTVLDTSTGLPVRFQFWPDLISPLAEVQSGVRQRYIGAGNTALMSTDSIPTSRLLKLPNIDEKFLILLTTVIAVGSVVVAIAGTKISKALAKRKNHKIASKQAAVRQAYTEWQKDPTNPELFNDYYKKQKWYNFQAKLFGWDSWNYGTQNFNGAASSAGASAKANFDLSKIQKSITG